MKQKNKVSKLPIVNYVNPNEQKAAYLENTCGSTDRRKLNPKKPIMAGNISFRRHNNLRFMKTYERRQVGLKNKL